MYEGIEIAKHFTIALTSGKLTHHHLKPTPWVRVHVHEGLSCEKKIVGLRRRFLHRRTLSREGVEGRGTGTLYTQHWHWIFCMPGLSSLRYVSQVIVVSQYRSLIDICKRTDCAASCTCTWISPSRWFVSLSSNSIKSYCTDLNYIGQV